MRWRGSGRSASFTQAVVVLTGNAECEALARIGEQVTDPVERDDAVREHLTAAEVFRPEILERIDRVYVFRPLAPDMLAQIAVIAKTVKEAVLDVGGSWVGLGQPFTGHPELVLSDHVHPTVAGQRMLADTIADHIASQFVLR